MNDEKNSEENYFRRITMSSDRNLNTDDRNNEVMKKCKRCYKEFPASPIFFRRNKDSLDGLAYFCKECTSEIGKAHYIKFDTEKIKIKGSLGVRCPLWIRKCGVCDFPEACWRIERNDPTDNPNLYKDEQSTR
jgi:hypothetical protein